jgi:hypothetical protein
MPHTARVAPDELENIDRHFSSGFPISLKPHILSAPNVTPIRVTRT